MHYYISNSWKLCYLLLCLRHCSRTEVFEGSARVIQLKPNWLGSAADATCGKVRKAKAHCTLQTWSLRMAAGLKVCASWKQLTIFSDWQIGCTKQKRKR